MRGFEEEGEVGGLRQKKRRKEESRNVGRMKRRGGKGGNIC